ncbi:MAG: sigma-70 family RNA polymerase sigma factor [Pseudomonadota bacterium]
MHLQVETQRVSGVAMPEETDHQLLNAVAAGDVHAFERLYRRYFRKVIGFAARITDRADLAEEVASDTLMTVWRSAERFEGRSRPSTWIFGIAYRIALKARTKRGPEERYQELDDQFPAESTGTEEVERLFLREQMGRALRTLSPEHRAVIELTYYYGHHYTEIAEIVGCPVGTVKTRMMHARRNLKQVLSAAPAASEEDR